MRIRNSQFSLKFIHFLKERPIEELRPIGIPDRVSVVEEISKVVLKEEARARAKKSLIRVQKGVASFNEEFDRII